MHMDIDIQYSTANSKLRNKREIYSKRKHITSRKRNSYIYIYRYIWRNEKFHILVLPIPVQGHINPMLQFSKRLISKGLKGTLVTAFINVETVQARGREIGIETISDITEVDRDGRSVDAFLSISLYPSSNHK